ncbi:helix-turn-helix transcriptional regulator [Colwellia demingiae]|uniref:Helix-turn-helix transcriptional regulator n=1 Tax=Colwellia demingiae TaxID=89401 RepID=A0A5C6QSA1_9GAMM|nr:helix-turn-helix transcriptional regulator [Colwellia demingiae]TWX71729.1 helix-turn-helix transcriptional regulator [Colwellia demingiae]
MDDFAKIIGKNIKVMRVQKDMSQADLAFSADIDQSYLSRVENGTVNITIIKLYKMTVVMNCTVQELLPEMDLSHGNND